MSQTESFKFPQNDEIKNILTYIDHIKNDEFFKEHDLKENFTLA